MFCYQCQETKFNDHCNVSGVCGKSGETAVLQDVLLQTCKELSFLADRCGQGADSSDEVNIFLQDGLFMTVTNANFDDVAIENMIKNGIILCRNLKDKKPSIIYNNGDGFSVCSLKNKDEMLKASVRVSVLNEKDEDIRSLTELLVYGLKGTAAYACHARTLGYPTTNFNKFMRQSLAYVFQNGCEKDKLISLVLECGRHACEVMEILDRANTEVFGKQMPSKAQLSLKDGKSILVSGHDMGDLHELLVQTQGKGINVYTHGEMLTAHAYPELKKFQHLVGHFGTAWHNQREEFVEFSGAILFTTNCIQKPADSYKSRVFTTGSSGYPGFQHIGFGKNGKGKDFSPVIDCALKSDSLKAVSGGELAIGFGKDTLMSVADKVIEAVKKGDITKFVVMAGCDGRSKSREYYTEIASKLPKSAVILTAGCAKYRYNSLELGDIGGIPRMLDAGQCNDSYSIAFIALQLQKAFGLENINDLPVVFDIAWYEQKAVAVLLALLHLGFKNIKLGPTLPAFLSANVAGLLVSEFGISGVGSVEGDLQELLS